MDGTVVSRIVNSSVSHTVSLSLTISVFFAAAYFILVLPQDQESSGLVLLVLISCGEIVGAIVSGLCSPH